MRPNVGFFSICAKNYMAYARTLCQSLRKHHTDSPFYLILADRIDGYFDPAAEAFRVFEAESLGIDDFAGMSFRYDVTEFNTAVKPFCFEFLFDHFAHDALVYLDPDIYVTGRFHEVEKLLGGGTKAVVTPHVCAPLEDGEKPDELSILRGGVYNLGFLALAEDPEVREFLAWWKRRLRYECRMDLHDGLHVDQKWVDLLPAFVERTKVLRHPGYNVAYWNLMHRRVRRGPNGWEANEQPLAFFHFSGVVPSDATVFSVHQTRFTTKNIGDVKQLLAEYRACLATNGQETSSAQPYAYDTIDGEYAIPKLVRRMYREYVEPKNGSVADPFASALRYCNAPAPEVVQEPRLLVTRLMFKIWQERGDLQQTFDLGTRDGRVGFVQWYMHTAMRELGMDEVFVGAVVERYHSNRAAAETGSADPKRFPDRPANQSIRRRLARSALAQAPRIRSLYRGLPEPARQKARNWLLRQAHGPGSHSGQSPDGRPPEEAGTTSPLVEPLLAPGALLVGYPRAELGMGEHVRLSAMAISTARIDFGIYEFGHDVEARQSDQRLVSHITDDPRFRANIFHINADQMDVVYKTLGRDFFRDRYNIGYWAWELQEFPDVWLPAMEHLQEIWAPSRFIQLAISEKARCPVVWMPLAVEVAPPRGIGREHFGIPEHAFVFLFCFDFASYASRKNPEAVVTAFQKAFQSPADNVALLIKSIGLDRHSSETDELRGLLQEDPRIVFIDQVLSHQEMAALVNCCDSFVSLHRSEGFGRGLAEAMFLGKPVIATNYSGNTDFTREGTACLVNYSLVAIEPGEYPEGEGQYWADPDIDHATWHMRRLVENPDLALRIGSAGKSIIRTNHSLSRVGARYKARLERLGLC